VRATRARIDFMMDAMAENIVVKAVLLLALGAGCSSSSGGHAGGGGGAGQCATQPPSAAPFNCLATYAEQLQANCEVQASFVSATAGECDGFQVAAFSAGYHVIRCGFDAQGALAWAERCEDAEVWCGTFCTRSATGPATLPSCLMPAACPGDAGTD
jgi:hypothetical protein